jgi:hypothetical protein
LEVKEAYDNLIDPELRKKFDVDYEQYYNNRQKNNHNFVTEANEEKKSVEKEKFNYSSANPFYAEDVRNIQETEEIKPNKDPWNDELGITGDFFIYPKKIGKIIHGFTNYSSSTKKNKKQKGLKMIVFLMKDAFLLLLILGLISYWISGFFTENIVYRICCSLIFLFLIILRLYFVETSDHTHKTTYINYFIGVNGFAYYTMKENNVISKLEVNFNQLTDLAIRYEDRKYNFKYVTTAYQYIWFNYLNKNVPYEISSTRNKNNNNELSKLTEYEYWLNKTAEKYWTIFLLDNLNREISEKGYLQFRLYHFEKNIYTPYINLGIGYITFLDGEKSFQYNFDEIKRIYTKGTDLYIEHINFDKKIFFIKSGNQNSIPLNNLCNRQFFFKSLELLLGYSIQ